MAENDSNVGLACIERDPVENFARQLDELCAATKDLSPSEDEDEDIPFGYEQLPQEDEEESGDNDNDDAEEVENAEMHNLKDDSDEVSVRSTASPLVLSLDPDESISEETSTLIKDIMKRIQVPGHAVPEWAKHIPESSWIPIVKE
ncbi:hypothetical protein [Absidia glauca]|uniref:Male-enhanced antigen 1 n=1 Tax=Absidia glauca TaxID=4829 RepID=A0A163JNF6_ABSGL|nr:hypothetical protein [Absidia glauca]